MHTAVLATPPRPLLHPERSGSAAGPRPVRGGGHAPVQRPAWRSQLSRRPPSSCVAIFQGSAIRCPIVMKRAKYRPVLAMSTTDARTMGINSIGSRKSGSCSAIAIDSTSPSKANSAASARMSAAPQNMATGPSLSRKRILDRPNQMENTIEVKTRVKNSPIAKIGIQLKFALRKPRLKALSTTPTSSADPHPHPELLDALRFGGESSGRLARDFSTVGPGFDSQSGPFMPADSSPANSGMWLRSRKTTTNMTTVPMTSRIARIISPHSPLASISANVCSNHAEAKKPVLLQYKLRLAVSRRA